MIKGAAGKYSLYEFSRKSITQIIHLYFRYDQLLPPKALTSLVPYCFNFEVKVLSLKQCGSYGYHTNTWFQAKTIINFT